jgi:SAM-dependent methyltransferase
MIAVARSDGGCNHRAVPQGDQYFLGHSTTEQRRLQQQAQELAPDSVRLFDRVRLSAGWRVVEIGCGPQGCLEILSERVGAEGSVVGVEVSEEAVALARAFVSRRRLGNVDVRHADGRATGLPRDTFDLATGRLVLINVPAPEQIVAEMAALVKPGGTVALHEADWRMALCDPPLPAWDLLSDAFLTYSRANGIDLLVGRRLARLLRGSGLTDVHFDPVVHVYEVTHSRRSIFPQFARNLRQRILASGIMTQTEFDGCVEALERHLADPLTVVMWTHFQAWATKPSE